MKYETYFQVSRKKDKMRVSFGKERKKQKRETEVRGDKLSAPRSPFRPLKFPLSLKGTLHETILDDDF